MLTSERLREEIRTIDHKGYGAYKSLKGKYDFGNYILCIDHVQGDPFASPSRVSVEVSNQGNFPAELYNTKMRRTALEDALLRIFEGKLYKRAATGNTRAGSGKSGMISICRPGQEVLERMAVAVGPQIIKVRMEIGFPAYGRSIAGEELISILFRELPVLVKDSFFYNKLDSNMLKERADLADDQEAIRKELRKRDLMAFVADESILPRESGVSQRPMKQAVPFKSPDSMAVELILPHRGKLRGMGIPSGITLIVGGGYHGKSTLLKALESGVYNHIPGDGREYVIASEDAVKLRAEEGRHISDTDISMFINNLPNKTDTTHFSTENASGSTSQAAATVEAMTVSKLFLLDEDTSATNFMIRDGLMAELVEEKKEPITPFISKVRGLYEKYGISTILVVGSQGDYFKVADKVLMMDEYHLLDVTEKAKGIIGRKNGENSQDNGADKADIKKASHMALPDSSSLLHYKYRKNNVEKVRVHGWDSLSLDKQEIDLRFVEQIRNDGQTAAIAYFLGYIFSHLADGEKNGKELVDELYEIIEKKGMEELVPSNYGAGAPQMPRRQETLAALLRVRWCRIKGRK